MGNHIELSQLTLPQIAMAVASGELRLAEAEAELRRRPSEPPRQRPRPRPPEPPREAEVMKALEATRRELRLATRRLADLGKKLETLSEQAAALERARQLRATSPGMRQRKLRLDGKTAA